MEQSEPKVDLAVPTEVACRLAQPEDVLWAGQPKQGVVFRTIDYVMIPFSILAACFFAGWSYIVLVKPVPIALKLMSIPAMGFAFYLVYGRFLLDARRRARTYYAVTTKRSLIISGNKPVVVSSFWHEDSQFDADNSRTITFGKPNGLEHMYAHAMGINHSNTSSPEFELVSDTENVRSILRSILAERDDSATQRKE